MFAHISTWSCATTCVWGSNLLFNQLLSDLVQPYSGRLAITSIVLFSPLGKLADRAIYFTFRTFFIFFIFFNNRQIISGSTGPIFAIFAPNDRYLFEYDRSGPLFWFFKGRCHGNQLVKNWHFFEPIYFVALPFRNGLYYRYSNFKRLNRMNFSTLCTILVTFGPETPEITLLKITPFAAIRQKSADYLKYLRISWTFLDLLYRFGRSIGGMIIPMFVCQSPKGCCYGNQLNL